MHVRLRASRIARLLGQAVPDADVARILEPLGFGVASRRRATGRPGTSRCRAFRVDVAREADLIEEVGRHYGFDRLPVTFPALTAPQPRRRPQIARDRRSARC